MPVHVTGASAFAFQGTNAHVVLAVDARPSSASVRAAAAWDRRRRWIGRAPHPLIGAVAVSVESASSARFEARGLNAASQAYLRDHRVNGAALFPAAGFLEVASAVVKIAFEEDATTGALVGVVIPAPLVMDA